MLLCRSPPCQAALHLLCWEMEGDVMMCCDDVSAMVQDGSREENAALLEALNSSGQLFMVSTDIGGKLILRFALGAASVQQSHVEAAWQKISQQADQMLSSRQ